MYPHFHTSDVAKVFLGNVTLDGNWCVHESSTNCGMILKYYYVWKMNANKSEYFDYKESIRVLKLSRKKSSIYF